MVASGINVMIIFLLKICRWFLIWIVHPDLRLSLENPDDWDYQGNVAFQEQNLILYLLIYCRKKTAGPADRSKLPLFGRFQDHTR